jgi:ArsR family transcriptional regulator
LTYIYIIVILIGIYITRCKLDSTYEKCAGLFKVLGEKNRLMIFDMLLNGEQCACGILEKCSITQPTLSHHMKVLCDCGLVKGRKEGKWTFYSITADGREQAMLLLQRLASSGGNANNRRCYK